MAVLFVNQCANLDFSFLSSDRGLVGETWLVDLKIQGMLDNTGILIDFSDIKSCVIQKIQALLDHNLWIPTKSSCCQYRLQKDIIEIDFQSEKLGLYTYRGPLEGVALLPFTDFNETIIADWLIEQLKGFFSKEIIFEFKLYPQSIQGAYYHYSHGLKHHAGNCQRIAHGHRSPVVIYVNQQRHLESEQRFAALWKDKYLACSADRVQAFMRDQVQYYQYGYTARQGRFELIIPAAQCYEIDENTTIECLAEHACQLIQTWHPNQAICVELYEGLNKGSIVISK
ncbi:MAG: 6-pyruvoyl tetrahydropterin reductase [Endozoicomonadaceae bacterium]|nr:6-pyruvoyl tetrahydropterin reductase [Endozoicomonadaceae bacterium]